jgi:Raf kinase inhibitor-like YbhB/YbcL family protein
MNRLGTYTIAALLAVAAALTACSSDSADEAVPDGSAGSAPAAAAAGESGLMLDTEEYKIQQQFPMDMEMTSTVFSRIRRIPIEYTCAENYWYPEAGFAPRYGEDRSPPLAWTAGPEGTKSYAIIADDPDAVEYEPGVTSPRVHWTIWNIPADVTELAEQVPTTTEVLSIGPNTRQGANDYLNTGWSGPCPPPNVISIYSRDDHPGGGKTTQYPHGYAFTVYALDTDLELGADATKNDLLEAMDGHILAAGTMTGEYINKKLYK